MTGKTVLVTGATGGIGLETARELSRLGARVIIGARDAAKGQAVVSEIARGGGQAEFLRIDMASFASIREAAARLAAAHPKLDVLVNNAGVVTKKREVSVDGHEVIWETNFLGAALLTRLLLPQLLAAPRPRVVNVSSMAHAYGRIDWNNLELSRNWRGIRAYANSKLALVLFTRELSRREPRIAVNAVASRRHCHRHLARGAAAVPVPARCRSTVPEEGSAASRAPGRGAGARRRHGPVLRSDARDRPRAGGRQRRRRSSTLGADVREPDGLTPCPTGRKLGAPFPGRKGRKKRRRKSRRMRRRRRHV